MHDCANPVVFGDERLAYAFETEVVRRQEIAVIRTGSRVRQRQVCASEQPPLAHRLLTVALDCIDQAQEPGIEQRCDGRALAVLAHAEHFRAVAHDDQPNARHVAVLAGLNFVCNQAERRDRIAKV